MLYEKLVAIMNIQENIAATFKTVMEERSMTLVVFVEEIGIARILLPGYLKKNSNPSENAIELRSEKLSFPASVLVSGPNVDLLDLIVTAKGEIHPLPLPLLQQCQDITVEIYRLSVELSRQDMLEGASRNE